MSRIVTFLVREIREMLPAFVFFLVLFHLIAPTRAPRRTGLPARRRAVQSALLFAGGFRRARQQLPHAR